jgi:hypothetical protein
MKRNIMDMAWIDPLFRRAMIATGLFPLAARGYAE